ncbi:MAG: succinate dehydrogenase, cytochrome b556 subunit [Pseudomonadota bacterium]
MSAASGSATPRPNTPPLSPHLQIWGWTVTMAASITHRATGIALYAGTVLLAIWAVALGLGDAAFGPVAALFASPLGVLVLGGYAWALFFHLMNGVKHLYQDTGRGLRYETAKGTAWFIYAASLTLAAITIFAGLSARGGAA